MEVGCNDRDLVELQLAASGKQEEDSEDEKVHECKEGSAMLRRALSIILGLGICKRMALFASEILTMILLSEPWKAQGSTLTSRNSGANIRKVSTHRWI